MARHGRQTDGDRPDDAAERGAEVARDVLSAPDGPEVHRDRREHGGTPHRVDDEALAERTEQERVDLGLDPYDPDEVPPAVEDPEPVDVTETPEYREERAEIRRQVESGELPSGVETDFPPTSYPER